jgi:DnaK suppressor protein
MTPEQLQDHREQLESLKTKLESDLADADGMAGVVKLDGVMGRISRMDAMQSQQMALALQRRQKEQLLRVKSALERVDKNQYGHCLRCQNPISSPRLEMIPEVVLCVNCAAKPRG